MPDRLSEIDEKLKNPENYPDAVHDLIWLRQRFADVSKKVWQMQWEQVRHAQQLRRNYQLDQDYLPQPEADEER